MGPIWDKLGDFLMNNVVKKGNKSNHEGYLLQSDDLTARQGQSGSLTRIGELGSKPHQHSRI